MSDEGHDSCNFGSTNECTTWFVTFPQSSGPDDTRRFVNQCGTGKNPSGGNDAGQTICCDAPTTQDATTGQCQVTADSCTAYNINAEPHSTDNTKCVCKTGFTGEPPACRDPNLASGLLPTGIPVTTATIGPDDIPGTGNTAKCETIGAVFEDSFGGGCRFTGNNTFVFLNSDDISGLTYWRDCALQRRPVVPGGCRTNQCAAGKVVRDNDCTGGTWNQCNERSGSSTLAIACDANATCSDSSESTTETALQLCTCNQGYTGDGTPGNCVEGED